MNVDRQYITALVHLQRLHVFDGFLVACIDSIAEAAGPSLGFAAYSAIPIQRKLPICHDATYFARN